MSVLTPKQVTVTSQFKAFGYRDGLSSGSEVSVVFDISEGTTDVVLAEAVLRERYKLDVAVLNSEFGKGHIPRELYRSLRQAVRESHKQQLESIKKKELP
jgi:hypothetical protein